jgi:hypothetical protein
VSRCQSATCSNITFEGFQREALTSRLRRSRAVKPSLKTTSPDVLHSRTADRGPHSVIRPHRCDVHATQGTANRMAPPSRSAAIDRVRPLARWFKRDSAGTSLRYLARWLSKTGRKSVDLNRGWVQDPLASNEWSGRKVAGADRKMRGPHERLRPFRKRSASRRQVGRRGS